MNKKDVKLFFSINSGEIYEALPDEVERLNQFQIPLLRRPKGCKLCYDRFHVGKNLGTLMYVPCAKCSKKLIDWDKLQVSTANAVNL